MHRNEWYPPSKHQALSWFVALGILAMAAYPAFSQSKSGPNSPLSQEPPGSAAAGAGSAGLDDPMLSGIMDPFDYESRGRRDPFVQPVAEKPVAPGLSHGPLMKLQEYEISQFKLVAIIWNVRRPKAMLQDPSGKTHIVGLNTRIGPRNGYIAVIREGEIVIVETIEQDGRLLSTAQVLKIAK
jgi:type IV pilus assembly protein PilP